MLLNKLPKTFLQNIKSGMREFIAHMQSAWGKTNNMNVFFSIFATGSIYKWNFRRQVWMVSY